MEEYILSASNRLFKGRFFGELLEFIDGKWVEPTKSVFGFEVDPREDGVEFFTSEDDAIKAYKARLSHI